jgi:diguanylate cyclase (GGDEF)-like protein
MRLLKDNSKVLAWQVLKAILSIYFLITFVVTVAQMGIEYVNVRNQIHTRLVNIEKIYQPALVAAFWELNADQVSNLQDKILALSFISAIRVIDEQGQETFRSNQVVRPEDVAIEHTFSLKYQVSNAEAHLANVTLMATRGVVFDLLKLSYEIIVINALIKSIALTYLFFLVFRKHLSEPLGKLTSQIETINLASLEHTRVSLGMRQENELSKLESSFNAMLHVLEAEQKANAIHQEEISRSLEKLVASRTEELMLANQKLEALVRTDPLTGLANRRFFLEQGNAEVQRALRNGPLSLLMLDLDHFKQVNDTWGHAVGDAVLINFAQGARSPLRAADLLARIGGEEFVVLLPDTTAEGASAVAERILEVVREQVLEAAEGGVTYTVSIGIAEFNGADDSLFELMKRADAALYQAKQSGRNRLQVFKNE